MSPWIESLTLTGQWVRLEPLSESHAADLFAAGRDPAVWAYLWRDAFISVADARAWIVGALKTAAMYSITDEEWVQVKAGLTAKLQNHASH